MSLGIATAAALSAAQPQEVAPANAAQGASQPAAQAAAQGVTSYPPTFFAASQPNTAFDMINRLPGFSFDAGDSVRGFGGAAGNVLIDGARPASKEDTLEDILKRIPVSQVLRIDVIRGGAPGVDMQGKTVIANVVRKTDGAARVTVGVAGNYVYDGRFKPSFRLEGSKRVGAVALEGGILAGWGIDDGAGDGPLIRRNPGGTIRETAFENTKGDGDRFNATGAAETPFMGGNLRINGFAQYNPYRYDVDDHFDPPVARLEQERYRDIVWQGEGGLRFTRPTGPKGTLELFFVQQLNKEEVTDRFAGPDLDADFSLSKRTGESVGRGVWKHRFTDNVSIELGAEGAFNWLDGATRYTQDGVDIPLPAANVRVEERRGEAFTTATWRLLPTVTVEGGLRYEYSKISSSGDTVLANSFRFAKPRATISWSPNEANQFRARVEREVGQLKFSDFVASSSNQGVHAGNPNLSPQQAWVFEAAYEHRFWQGAQFSATMRHYRLTDAIDRAPIIDQTCVETSPPGTNCAFDAPFNIGEGTKDEVALNLTLPTDKLGIPRGQLQAQSTWRRSRVIDPTTHLAREISGLRPLEWEVHFTQGLPKWRSTWGFDVFGAWRETYYRFNEIDTDELHTWVSLFTEYKPRSGLAIRVEIDNLTARSFAHQRDVYPGLRSTTVPTFIETRDSHFGRMLYVRVRKTFG